MTQQYGAGQAVAIAGAQVYAARAVGVDWWLAGGVIPRAAYAAKGAASYAASKINLPHPGTEDAGDGSTLASWDSANGWGNSGGEQCVTTPLIPNFGWTMIVRYSNISAGGTLCVAGSFHSPSGMRLILFPYVSNNVYYGSGNAYRSTVGGLLSGTLAISGNKCYRNGTPDGLNTGVDSGTSTIPIYILLANTEIGLQYPCGGYVQAVWITDSIISDAAVALQHAAMMAL